jgi:hypothetical protein
MTEQQPWKREVQLDMLGRGKNFRRVRSTEDAAHVLLNIWPRERGKYLQKARLACLHALEGEIPDEEAREAFIAAAEEAKLFVRKV